MNTIPVIGFSGFSGSGKTTVIERLLPILSQRGIVTAVLKHDGHTFEMDRAGKDSYRFGASGAAVVVVSSEEKTAIIDHRTYSLEDNLRSIKNVDLILVEGYKYADLPQIGISRKETGKGLPKDPRQYLAIVTDEAITCPSVPLFSFEETEQLAAFLLEKIESGSI